MNKLILLLTLLLTQTAYAIEEAVFKIQGTDLPAVILKQLGAPKSARIPTEFKSKDIKIKVEQVTPDMIAVDFTPSHPFTISENDLFEKIDVNDQTDRINHSLILADSKTGRIFHLNSELKVSKMEILKPWSTKEQRQTLKAILNGMNSNVVEKKK